MPIPHGSRLKLIIFSFRAYLQLTSLLLGCKDNYNYVLIKVIKYLNKTINSFNFPGRSIIK